MGERRDTGGWVTRGPRHPALQGVVTVLWAGRSAAPAWSHERMVPTGKAHLVVRPDVPIRLGKDGSEVHARGAVGGPRSRSHVHDCPGARSIGVVLAPGALPRLFRESSRALAERHTGLELLWGTDAERLRQQLAEVDNATALDRMEALLVRRLQPDRGVPLGRALASLAAGARVDQVARALGRSERTLRAWFDTSVGLSPRRWARLSRLGRAVDLAQAEPDLSAVAHRAGYFDHAHLCRDVRDIVGVTPSELRAHAPGQPRHIPLPIRPSVVRPRE